MFPDQTSIDVKVYQGESPTASQNTLLGEFRFEGLEQEQEDQPPRITVEFDLDVNGILNVSAVDRGSKASRQTTLRAAHTRLSPNDKEASAHYLAGLERAPEDADDSLLARARQVLQNKLEGAEDLAQTVAQLEAAKGEGRVEDVAALEERLLDLLYEAEGEE